MLPGQFDQALSIATFQNLQQLVVFLLRLKLVFAGNQRAKTNGVRFTRKVLDSLGHRCRWNS
jgi:hypothetical protein